jgi:hypothetical protein
VQAHISQMVDDGAVRVLKNLDAGELTVEMGRPVGLYS